MINIAYVIDTIDTPYAGTEKQLLSVIRLLDRSRYRPHLVCLRQSDWLKTADVGCPVSVMNFGSFFSMSFLQGRRRFVAFCQEHKIDIVQSFFRDSNHAGTLWAHKAKVGVVIASRRNIGSGYWHNSREIAILKFLKRYTTHYITNSEAAAAETREVEGVAPGRISVLRNGLDIGAYPLPSAEAAARAKNSWGFSEDAKVIGAVANLRPIKNIEFLIRAAKTIIEKRPGAKFVVLGEGDSRPELEQMIADSGLTGTFLLPGRSDNVARDLAGFDIAVLCSHRESLSNSLMEYMATGRAVVASDVGGNGELISRRDLGYLYPADDSEQFENRILELLDDAVLRENMGRAAREEATRTFSWEAMIRQLENIYESLMTDPSHSARRADGAVVSAFKRTSFRLRDFARFNPTSRLIAAKVLDWRDRLAPPHDADGYARSVENLSKAARICPSTSHLHRLEKRIGRRIDQLDPSQLDWDAIFPHSKPREIRKGVILKKPISEREKGVLFIAFEDHWLRLLRYVDLKTLHSKYHLVLAPTWSPPHDLPMTLAAKMWPGALFNIMSAVADQDVFARLTDNLVSVPLISSNWVNPDVFAGDDNVRKEFDIVMLANFAMYKRHWLMFDVLSKLPPITKLLLLGRGWEGRSADVIMNEARTFGCAGKVTMKEGLSDADMIRAIKSARVSLIFSGNEGACVAVVEAMFADVPVGLFADAVIGSKSYVNEQTGCLFTRGNVVQELRGFINNHEQFQPRKWVLENGISYVESTKILNNAIRDAVLKMGEDWTLDIHAHQWRPNPAYLSDNICREMRPYYDAFEKEFGIPLITAGVNDL